VAAGTATCDLGILAKGGSVTRSFPATGPVVGTFTATADVSSPTPDPDTSDNEDTAAVTVTTPATDMRVVLTVDRNPGLVGGAGTATVTVVNGGPSPVAQASLRLSFPSGIGVSTAGPSCLVGATPCALGALATEQPVSFTVALSYPVAVAGSITALAGSELDELKPGDNSASVLMEVKQPVLTVTPGIGSPGSVLTASGKDFPQGAEISLAWDNGLTERRANVRVGANLAFGPAPILVFRRDALGPRQLVATSTTPGLMAPVRVAVLVVPPTVTPPFAERS
jgi:hypothetical protein